MDGVLAHVDKLHAPTAIASTLTCLLTHTLCCAAAMLLLPHCTAAVQGGSTGYKGAGNKSDLDNHANQLNPNNPNFQGSGGQQQRK